MKNTLCVMSVLALSPGAFAQSVYNADYTNNPFLDGSATDLDDSSWVSSAYGRDGAVVSNPLDADNEESFFSINSSFYSGTVNSIGDSLSLTTSFYSDSTTGSGDKESTVLISLAPGLTVLLGDIGDGSGNEQISLGVGSGYAVVTNPGFTLTTDEWVDVSFTATYAGDTPGGIATFDYELILAGGMTGTYNASAVVQPSHSFYDIVGTAHSPQFGQEADADAQTVYWAASEASTVPEPSSVTLLGLAVLAGIGRRRR